MECYRTSHRYSGTWRGRSLKTVLCVIMFLLSALLSGCDGVSRHKVLTTIFDGVPSLPPADRMCEDYYDQRVAAEAEGEELGEALQRNSQQRSSHKPYAEKKCNDCHSKDKNLNDGLIAPKSELCYVCHKDVVKGKTVHGPVAVGDCLACHLPHSSNHKALLVYSPDELCQTCHQEQRLAAAMHDRFLSKTISCGECHDPHSGDARYFLK